ncbi:MAG TPA: alpha/beta hydrolase [Myxococcales bacterium]|nr:alpha/beta hydrolase [Myxococcales bacterium]
MRLLLLPGMDGTGDLFASFLRFLPPDVEPQVVAYSRERPLGYEQLAREIPIPSVPFAILAESFSGPLGIRIAARHPGLTRGLVLVATFIRSPSPALVRLAALLAPLIFRRPPPAFALRWMLAGSDASDSEVAEVRAVLESLPARILASRLRAIAGTDVSTDFAAVAAPILYVLGTRDRLVPSTVPKQLQAIRPDIELCSLDASHLVLQRKPAEAAAAISKFLVSKARLPGS